jgi:hypothetical protein
MTPKEKAIEMFNKMYQVDNILFIKAMDKYQAKQCALIAVEEIEKAIDFDWMEVQNLESEHRYWEQVKEELRKL